MVESARERDKVAGPPKSTACVWFPYVRSLSQEEQEVVVVQALSADECICRCKGLFCWLQLERIEVWDLDLVVSWVSRCGLGGW